MVILFIYKAIVAELCDSSISTFPDIASPSKVYSVAVLVKDFCVLNAWPPTRTSSFPDVPLAPLAFIVILVMFFKVSVVFSFT